VLDVSRIFLQFQLLGIVFDLVEQPDEVQDFPGRPGHDLLRGCFLDVHELATDMSHAAKVNDIVRFPQGQYPAIAVGLDIASEVVQKVFGDKSRPRRIIAVDHGRPFGIAATEEPQVGRRGIGSPRFLGGLQACFVHVDGRTGSDLRLEKFMKRIQGLGYGHGPSGHGMTRNVHTQAGKLLGLSVERHGIDELGGEDLGQQTRRGEIFGDDLQRHECNAHHRHALLAVAGRTGVLGADMALDLYDGRNVVELFGDLFADALQAAPAGADFLVFGQIVDDFDARQVIRQRLAPTLNSGVGRDLDDGHFRRLHLCDLDQRQRQNVLEEIFRFLGFGSIQGGLQQSHAVLKIAVLLVVIPDQMLSCPTSSGRFSMSPMQECLAIIS